MTNLPDTHAVRALKDVIDSGVAPETLDKVYDLLKLMGLILGHSALLAVASDVEAEPKDRVAAAKALVAIKETPQEIAERLKRAPFTDLSVDQLRAMIQKIESGESDITLITQESDHGHSPSQ